MTPATREIVAKIAREAGAPVDVSNDPNSAPSWWACGHNDVWERFFSLAMERAAGICDGEALFGSTADDCAAAIREAAK